MSLGGLKTWVIVHLIADSLAIQFRAMTIAYVIENVNIGSGVVSNSVLIFLSLRFSKQNLGTYRYLLMIFAFYDLVLTVIHSIVDPKVFNFDTVFTIYSSRFPDNAAVCCIYCSCFTVPLTLTVINLLHRYWAVKKPEKLELFSKPPFVALISMYPIGQFVLWSWISFQSGVDDDHFVRDYYLRNFNETITGCRVLHHWKNGEFNGSAFFVIVSAMVVMSFNVSIGLFLATRTIAQIREAKSFSFNYKMLQFKILRALFAQILVPVLFVFIPFGCALMFPFLKINDVFHIANFCMTTTSFYPAWDAIVVILLIKDYRDGLISLFGCGQKVQSAGTTVWMTHTTTTTVKID